MKDSYHLVGGESSGCQRAEIEVALQVGWDVPPGRVVDARCTWRPVPPPPLDFFLARADYKNTYEDVYPASISLCDLNSAGPASSPEGLRVLSWAHW